MNYPTLFCLLIVAALAGLTVFTVALEHRRIPFYSFMAWALLIAFFAGALITAVALKL